MGNGAKTIRQNRTITVNFQDQSTYFELLRNGKAFVEFVLAFLLSIGLQLAHKTTCTGGGCLTRQASITSSATPKIPLPWGRVLKGAASQSL
jgi:hypothetical protein